MTERQPADVEAFFEGVDEMRAHLDRGVQDPERRRARLAAIAHDLLKPRDAVTLASWLVDRLCEALGGRACSLLLPSVADDASWQVWKCSGASMRFPDAELIARVTSSGDPFVDVEAFIVALPGVRAVVGLLWLEGVGELDVASRFLLRALADTAGVMLEQVLSLEAMR